MVVGRTGKERSGGKVPKKAWAREREKDAIGDCCDYYNYGIKQVAGNDDFEYGIKQAGNDDYD